MQKYIDVEKLKNFDFNKIFDYKASFEICLGIETVLMIAEKMPSADVQEVKHGYWLYCRNNDYDGGVHTAECSNCRITQSVVFYQRKPIFKYCPHCGAIMDGDQK